MVEEIITSGRNNPLVDPTLHVWGWPIPLYLFLGGLAAGIMFFSALFTLTKRENKYPVATKIMPLSVPFILVIGLAALWFDLSHKLYFWQLYTNIRWVSPMSWGAWTLLLITPLSILWAAHWLVELYPEHQWKWPSLSCFLDNLKRWRRPMAWANIFLAIILGMYTGILLSAFNARPFWNTAILGPLFLTSGLSAAAAVTAFFAKNEEERLLFIKTDLFLLGTELFLIVHMLMGFLAGTRVHIQAADLVLGGPYTMVFWVFVIGLGILLPIFLEIMDLTKRWVPAVIPALLVIFGNLMLRFVIVALGQASRWLYQ